jgi:rhodanese-related sulfurtransferase
MSPSATRALWLLALGLLALCALPTIAYCMLIARAPHLDARAARQLLSGGEAQVVFVEPLEESTHPVFAGVTTTFARLAPGKPTLLFCRGGIRSALAAQRLRRAGISEVWSVAGGMQEWIASGGGLSEADLARMGLSPATGWLRFRAASAIEPGLLLVSFFGVKTVYTLLAIAVTVLLWRRAEPELAALRRALVCFVVGEAACFVNVMFCAERSVAFEHLHGLSMAVSLGFTCFAGLQWFSQRLDIRAAERTCVMLPICGLCSHQAVCRLRRLAQLGVPMFAALAGIPLTAELKTGASTTLVLGRLHGYGHPVIHQLFELRYLPLVAFGLCLVCEARLLLGNRQDATIERILFSAAAGALGFSYLRLLFVVPFADHLVWFAVWEEFTELLYVAAIVAVLWVFRQVWFEPKPVAP